MSQPSVSKIVSETSMAIWECLQTIVFQGYNEQTCKEIAKGFEREWDFKLAIGAVDSKLVKMLVQYYCTVIF